MLGRAIALASGFCSLTLLAHAAEPTLLHVNTFPTARSLPFYVAVDRGFFARRGLKVELEFTESSERQRQGLAGGTVDIVHSAVDNAVAMIDVAKVDVVIVSGGDSGTNEFYVQDTIKDFSDIRGKAIVVDATNTAYALQARKILGQHGLRDGTDYSLNPVGNGQRRLKALFDDKNNAGADAHWEPHLQITDPDGRVAVTYLLTATLQTQMGPVLASGQKISLRGVHVLHQQGGLIRRSEDYWDATTFQRQLDKCSALTR